MDTKDLGNVIRQARVASGMSQGELATALKVSRATVNYLENGTSDVAISTVLAACELLGVHLLPTRFPKKNSRSAVEWAMQSANTSYRNEMKSADLYKIVKNVEVQKEFVPQVSYILNELSEPRFYGVVREIAERSKVDPRLILKNFKKLAQELKAAHPRWTN